MFAIPPLRTLAAKYQAATPPSGDATITYLQDAGNTSGLSTYTFSSQNLGTAAADRFIVVAIETRNSGTSDRTINSVTIGGVSAVVTQETQAGTNRNVVALACAAVPTGTAGDVVVTLNGAMLRCYIQVYRAIGISSTTPSDTERLAGASPTGTIDVPAGGILVACAASGNALTTDGTWTGVDLAYNAVTTNMRVTTGAREFATVATGHTATATFGGTITDAVGVAASFGPAA